MIYDWIVTGAWAVFLVIWIISSFSAKRSVRNSRSFVFSIWFRLAIIVIVVVLVEALHRSPYSWLLVAIVENNHSQVVSVVGVLFAVVGVVFAIWARFSLGRNWGMPMTQRAEPELVTSGPYKYVRHPIYTGVLLAILGSALASEYMWLFVLVVAGAYFTFSAREEEKFMLQQFPNQYPDYMKRSKMLIPFVF